MKKKTLFYLTVTHDSVILDTGDLLPFLKAFIMFSKIYQYFVDIDFFIYLSLFKDKDMIVNIRILFVFAGKEGIFRTGI